MPKVVNNKSSQEERPWPSTQQMLLDHLRRIVEGVYLVEYEDPPDEQQQQWWFGSGDDCLISRDKELKTPEGDDRVFSARIQGFLSLLAVEARDRPSGVKKDHQEALKALSELFEGRPDPRELFRRVLPEGAHTEVLQQASAFEMLNKLKQVADRSKQRAVQEILLLKDVPEGVDNYMVEAAACFRYGFDKACLAVCRMALEESLKRRIERDHGREYIQTYDPQAKRLVDKGLRTLIDDAHKLYGPKQPWAKPRGARRPTYLNDQMERAADRIRRWGNGAVHGKSDIPRGVVESRAQKALLYSKQLLRHLWA